MNKLGTVDSVGYQNEPASAAADAVSNQQPVQVTTYDFPTEVIDLPSRGLLYPPGSPLASGKIEIKYMTAKEEDILSTTSYIKQGIVLDKLCESIIVTPKVKLDDLLLGDKTAVLFAARAYGYGPEYATTVELSSGRTVPVSIDLTNLPHKTIDESLITPGQNRFSFTLPRSNKTIEFKLLTVGDDKKIEADLRGIAKAGLNASSRTLTTRFKYMILSVDGKTDASSINKFVDNMLAADSKAFREYVAKIQPDVDISVDVEDPETGEPFRGDFTIGANLFYPDFKG